MTDGQLPATNDGTQSTPLVGSDRKPEPSSIVALLAMSGGEDIECDFPPLSGPLSYPADLT